MSDKKFFRRRIRRILNSNLFFSASTAGLKRIRRGNTC